MGRARIFDVAAAAGVSVTTVSLVLNNAESRISEETRQRVREAAEAVGYSASAVARGLRTQRTRIVGLISDQIATTPFAGRMLAGAQDAARESGHMVMLVDTGGETSIETEAVRAMTAQQVDGLLYAAMWHRGATPPAGLPKGTVFLDCYPIGGGFPSVVPDDWAGGQAAVRELLAAGHRRIAYLDTSDREPIASRLRHDGYLHALREAGIEPDPALHVRGETSAQGGRAAADELLDLPEDRRPTAIFCFNDRMAIGVYTAAHHRGLEIPRDLSVVGYDDQQLVAAELDPPLTTIALPHYEMGRWAMEVALGVRAEGDEDAAHRMECPVIRRSSVGPPPAHVGKQNRRRASHVTEGPRAAAPDRVTDVGVGHQE
ncbi:LacI family DNA-binding transcriptional regulator [Microbacterium sp. TNHR37B]|uniref:LacI family DNA-binding transcriptional regulator n=1 Tax=Microbacterium sp. TNHR37B TaxID=1775956 RepID=UPI0007B19312|nr:LacI family DNA-binding transcriptional regulator [Microbacterium sp. TNHR37B]KZE91970.1 HTH-type transcriptional repressor CytR [Microbacterium sp. TNHR37B]